MTSWLIELTALWVEVTLRRLTFACNGVNTLERLSEANWDTCGIKQLVSCITMGAPVLALRWTSSSICSGATLALALPQCADLVLPEMLQLPTVSNNAQTTRNKPNLYMYKLFLTKRYKNHRLEFFPTTKPVGLLAQLQLIAFIALTAERITVCWAQRAFCTYAMLALASDQCA